MSWPRAITTTSLALWLLVGVALGAPPRAPAQERQPAATTRGERPPEGSWRRGLVSLPAVAVAGAGALVVLSAVALLTLRARRRRR